MLALFRKLFRRSVPSVRAMSQRERDILDRWYDTRPMFIAVPERAETPVQRDTAEATK